MSSHPEPSRTLRVFGETDSGARNLPRFLCSLLEPGSVLVLGASEMALVASTRHDVTVVDSSHPRLVALRERAREQGRDVRFQCRDPAREELGLAPRSFRNAVCLDALERFPNDVAVLEKLQRVLAPGGRLVVRVPARPWSGDGAISDLAARRYDPESLRGALEEASFLTVRLRHWNLVGVASTLREGRHSLDRLTNRRIPTGGTPPWISGTERWSSAWRFRWA
jgi:SAM-dependent methyltransferase